jgi:hypothetical protein
MDVCASQDEEEWGERVGLGKGGRNGANENGMRCLFVCLLVYPQTRREDH